MPALFFSASATKELLLNIIKQSNDNASIDANDPVKAKEALLKAEKILDSTASKKVIHKNADARYKSRLNKAVKALG